VTPFDAARSIEEKLAAASAKSAFVQLDPSCSGLRFEIAASDEKHSQTIIWAPTADPESLVSVKHAVRSLIAHDSDESTATIAVHFDELSRRIR
jgi:hypothetical protein